MSFMSDITPYTTPDPGARRSWALVDTGTTYYSPGVIKHYEEINHANWRTNARIITELKLPALPGVSRYFTKLTLYYHARDPIITNYYGDYRWFVETSRYKEGTVHYYWYQTMDYLDTFDKSKMTHDEHYFASPLDFFSDDLGYPLYSGWYSFNVGGPHTGLGAIYEENSYSSCSGSIYMGLIPPNDTTIASYPGARGNKSTWLYWYWPYSYTGIGQYPTGFILDDWHAQTTHIEDRPFILFEYDPLPEAKWPGHNKMFQTGQQGSITHGVN